MVRRWNAARGGQDGEGAGEQQQRDWRYGLLRPALAAACAVFAIGVALAIPPLREAFVQLGSAVGISSSSTGGGGTEPEWIGYPERRVGRRRQPGRYLGRPEQRAGDRVSVGFAVVHRGRADRTGQIGDDTDRGPGESGEQPDRRQHGHQSRG